MNISSPFLSIVIPNFLKMFGITPRSFQLTFFIVSSLFVIAARPIQLPISIISGSMVCSVPDKLFTPLIVNKLEPIPIISAPIRLSILQSCCRYGSHAALYIVVVPSAKTAAITIFAVPVTEASSRSI